MQADTNRVKERIGRRIAAVRTFRGLRQSDLAALLDVNRFTVSKWERGIQLPDADTVALICSVLDCSADFLLGLSETVKRA